jgi:hypothetical protein
LDLFRVRTLPFMARRNYYFELKNIVPWSVAAGLVEGQFASVIVAKTFSGTPLQIAIAASTPVAAMMSSLVWGMLCIGRPKIRLLAAFSTGVVLCLGTVAAIPASPLGTVWFIAQMAAAQVLLSGVITTRSAVWKSNYPHAVRGRIAGRLQAVRILLGNATVLAAARICDIDPTCYRYIYPVAAAVGLCSMWVLPRIHIRSERNELTRHRQPSQDGDLRADRVEPFDLTALLSPGHVLRRMFRILRDDRRFTQYCIAQFLTGMSNLMTIAIVVAIVTQDLPFGDGWGFWISAGLIETIPRLVMLGSIGRWAALFDRVGVVRFRVVNVVCWNMSIVFGLIATLISVSAARFGASVVPLAACFFALRAISYGLGRGGGALAWYLGHLHFARPEEAELYMGIHVSLTGMRGLIAPLIGMGLYQLIGWPVWLIALACSLSSLSIFASMARRERREGPPTQTS